MNFFEKVTGSDITREIKEMDERVKKLPIPYQDAWVRINDNFSAYGDFTGRNLLSIYSHVLELLEEASAEGQSIEAVLGEDIESFCREAAAAEGAKNCRDKWRDQLNRNITKKLGELK